MNTPTNVFVLCTGRSGSLTFARACSHLTNWTAGHETRARNWRGRLSYPTRHIEVDHRLSWFLGPLDELYGDEAVYVHLTRDPEATARSWAVRRNRAGQQRGWEHVVLYKPPGLDTPDGQLEAARLMVATVTSNIDLFLRDKTQVVRISIEDPHDDFTRLLDLIDAEGDFDAAHATLEAVHNAGRQPRAEVAE